MENITALFCLFVFLATTNALAAEPDEAAAFVERRKRAAEMRPKLQALINQFEARTFGSDQEEVIPYRLFKPQAYDATKKYPLVLYFHGSGGVGRDNRKQISRGSLYGARVWALPENQAQNPCFILAPQLMKGPAIWRDMKVWGEKVSDSTQVENSIAGTWVHMLEIPAGETELELVLRQEGEKWTGCIRLKAKKVVDQLEVVYEDPVLTYRSFGRIAIHGQIEITGNTFTGTASRQFAPHQ